MPIRAPPSCWRWIESGRLDEQTVPIDGVNALDDAEALTGAPDGRTYYLMTSHSPNHKGKVRRSRRQLLRLALEGRRLRVTGSLDLLQDSDGVVRRLEKLGLPAQTPVDLEGLCFHDGALYVGLKAPLLRQRRGGDHASASNQRKRSATASSAPPPSLCGGAPGWPFGPVGAPPGSSPWYRKESPICFSRPTVPCTCAPIRRRGDRRMAGAACGAWPLRARGGALDAKLLRRFPGLKPEGVTLAPDGGALTAGLRSQHASILLWMTWPLAAARPHGGAEP